VFFFIYLSKKLYINGSSGLNAESISYTNETLGTAGLFLKKRTSNVTSLEMYDKRMQRLDIAYANRYMVSVDTLQID
jgi:hypothetical protein